MKLIDINDAVLIWGIVSQAGLLELKQEGRMVLVPENRPYLLGLKRNIPLLEKEGINFVYCADNVLGLLFYKGKIKKTILFYEEKTKKAIVGICGSLYVSLLSKFHNVPVKPILQGDFSLELLDKDASTLDGKSFIRDEDKKNCVIKADDELVKYAIIDKN